MTDKLAPGFTQIQISKVIVKNRYRHDKGPIEEMADSLKRLGLINPITLDEDGNLLAGERRILGALKLGWKSIPARVVKRGTDPLDVERDENVVRKDFTWQELTVLEKAIYDRQVKAGKWSVRDQAALRATPKSTVHERIQLAEAIELIPELAQHETQADAWKAFKKLEEAAVIKHMEANTPQHIKQAPIWAEEHYRIGDALQELAKTGDGLADFAELDPPYAIDFNDRKGRNADQDKVETYDEMDVEEYPAILETLATNVFRILKPDSFAVFWYGLQWHDTLYRTLIKAGFSVNPIPAIWYKGQSGQTNQPDIMFASCYEPFFLARKGSPRLARAGRSNVFHFPPVAPSRKIHLTEKPIELLKEIMGTILFPGSTVLVPFLGSGVSLRAAYSLGHTGFGWDLSEVHKKRFLKLVAGENGEQEQTLQEGAGEPEEEASVDE